jgi:hypothetical protein
MRRPAKYLRYAIRNRSQSVYKPGDPAVWSFDEVRAPVSLIPLRRMQLGDSLASRVASKSKEELKVQHSYLESSVEPGRDIVGVISFDRPQSAGLTVLRLTFAQEVTAMLVL